MSLKFVMYICLISICFSSIQGLNPHVEDTWNEKTPMTYGRSNFGVVAVDGKIYAIGGDTSLIADFISPCNVYPSDYVGRGIKETKLSTTGVNERYDPVTDTWVTLEPMPTSRKDLFIVAYQNKIYCIGDNTYAGSDTTNFANLVPCIVNEVYDIATNSRSTKTSPSFNGTYRQTHVIDGKIYTINCSADLLGHKGTIYMYDPVADSWTQKTTFSSPKNHSVGFGASFIVDNKITVFAVFFDNINGGDPNKILTYDPEKDILSEGKTITRTFSASHCAMTTGDYVPQKIYLTASAGSLNYDVYDTVNDTGSFTKNMSTSRGNFEAIVVDDPIYVIGGDTLDTHRCALNEQYVPIDYIAIPLSSEPSDPLVTSEPTPSKYLSTHLIVATLAITIGAVVTSLIFLFKARKKECS